MSTISNLFQRLDILHVDSVPHTFTIQMFDKTSNAFIPFSNGSTTLFITDSRGNNVGTPTIEFQGNNTLQVSITESVPAGYIGTLKYKILYTDDNTGFDMWLLVGNINCVDLGHIPAETSAYIPSGSNVVVQTTLGSTNNFILELQNGLPGIQGEQGIQGKQGNTGEPGAPGEPGAGASIGFIRLTSWHGTPDFIQTGTLLDSITLVYNDSGENITFGLTLNDGDQMIQSTQMTLNYKDVVLVFRSGSNIYWKV